jgi:glutathionylspermidine synthase
MCGSPPMAMLSIFVSDYNVSSTQKERTQRIPYVASQLTTAGITTKSVHTRCRQLVSLSKNNTEESKAIIQLKDCTKKLQAVQKLLKTEQNLRPHAETAYRDHDNKVINALHGNKSKTDKILRQ